MQNSTGRGRGAPKGSRNAAKGRGGTIHVPANPDVKASAVSVLSAGESLADLVEQAVIMEVLRRDPVKAEEFGILGRLRKPGEEEKPNLPRWTKGLSERAARCLVSAGYRGRVAVKKDLAAGVDFSLLQNAGNRVAEEVRQWCG